jgi:hypothetical protein
MAFSFETNLPYPNRIQWILNNYQGPLSQDGPLGDFDPRRDLEVYVDGVLIPVRTFSFDTLNNRYLFFMESTFNLQGVVQIIHHMPNPAFVTNGGLIYGFGSAFGWYFGGSTSGQVTLQSFALIASYSTAGDTSNTPSAALAVVPNNTTLGVPLVLIWNTTNIAQIEITANNGIDPPFDSGLIDTFGSGIYTLPNGVSTTTIFTMKAYDTSGYLALSPTATVTLPNPPMSCGFGMGFGLHFGACFPSPTFAGFGMGFGSEFGS